MKKLLQLSIGIIIILSTISVIAQDIEPMESGKYEPTWESLKQYEQAPEWFQDAKFGIWAHWGPQCEPEQGDWYARFMYYTNTWQYQHHVATYGNPTEFGFKDVINEWKAENWNPDSLVHLYKEAGAQYFFAMANHHDNLDMWDSKYQPWNSVAVGPKKNIISDWAKAAKKYELPFGVSVHASHAWTWLEPSQNFDGKLTKADGAGKWWEGLDPQDLYAQNHVKSTGSSSSGTIHSQWNWSNGASIPDSAYLYKFYNRTIDLINKYNPDLLYFDDTALPFDPISDVGRKIAAHFYNKSEAEHNGKNEAVIFGKILTEAQKEAMVWDVERGVPDRPQEKYWQTCTCIGDWHYSRSVYENKRYKSAQTVIRMLVDIVSKNGNLLLNIPVRGDGTIDSEEYAVVQGIKKWMDINKQSIYGTRPWITFGEGPTADAVNPISAQGFNEGTNYSNEDIRYVSKNDTIYATVMGWPGTTITLKELSTASKEHLGSISKVTLLGHGTVDFVRDFKGLTITLPNNKISTGDVATVFEIVTESASYSYNELNQLIEQCKDAVATAENNAGYNTGQYMLDSLEVLKIAIINAQDIPSTASDLIITNGIKTLQSALYTLRKNGLVQGGHLSFESTQDITRAVLVESRNFSRSDDGIFGTGRWGLLAEPWVYTNNIVNQENNSRGSFDNYNNSKSIGIQKWNATDAAIVDGMIYQTTTLPAGNYKIKISVHEQYGLQSGEIYLNVSKGSILEKTADIKSKTIAYYDMANSSTGNEFTVCEFSLDATSQVSIGWTATLAASASSRSIRVNKILLLDGEGKDISSQYIENYENIQRKDISYPRFGIPKYWSVDNFNIPQSGSSDGTKKGIDRYSGYNSLMLGVWNDKNNAVGDLSDVKIYQEVTLPAGKYAFMAGYDQVYNLTNMYLFVSETLPTLSTLKESAISYYSMINDSNDGQQYGFTFSLDKETSVYLGWIGDLTEASTQEFRATNLSLLRILSSDDDYLPNMSFNASESNTTYPVSINQFDSVGDLVWLASADDFGYLKGELGNKIIIGDINFGAKKYANFFVNTANNTTSPDNAKYDFYIDNQSEPVISASALYTNGSLLFDTSESDTISISGIHKVSVMFNNHSSNLNTIGIETHDFITGVSNIDKKDKSYNVYSTNNSINIDNLSGEVVAIYSFDGRKMYSEISKNSFISIPVQRGIYIVTVNEKAYKIRCD